MTLDKTFCATPNCKNECGRRMAEDERALSVKLAIPISYAYFCGEPESIKKENTCNT